MKMINGSENQLDCTIVLNTNNKYSAAHQRRRLKTLNASPTKLDVSVAQLIALECWRNLDDDEAVLVLASLLLGWSVEKLSTLKQSEICQVNQSYYLRSPWSFSEVNCSDEAKKLFITSSDEGMIPLSEQVAKRLSEVLESSFFTDNVVTKVKGYLLQNPVIQKYSPSLSSICRNIEYNASKVLLSPPELDLIRATAKRKSMQSFYVCFDQSTVHMKLIKYQTSLLDKNSKILNLSSLNERFGSKRGLTSDALIEVFDQHKTALNRHWQLTQSEFHNAFTSYALDLYHLATATRPSGINNLTIKSFNYDFSSVVIRDKGATSLRRILIPPKIQCVLQSYKTYLESLYADFRTSYPDLATNIVKMLNGSDTFFKHWDLTKSKLVKAILVNHKILLGTEITLPSNWHRHTIATHLVGSGISRESLEIFMGHHPTLDHSYSELSSLSFTPFISIGNEIEKLLNNWNIPSLLPHKAIQRCNHG